MIGLNRKNNMDNKDILEIIMSILGLLFILVLICVLPIIILSFIYNMVVSIIGITLNPFAIIITLLLLILIFK